MGSNHKDGPMGHKKSGILALYIKVVLSVFVTTTFKSRFFSL